MIALSPAQASAFLTKARKDRWHALWVLLVTSGLQPGEALGLRWTDLDGEKLRVQRTLVRQEKKGWSLMEP